MRRTVITGANRGIGLELAKQCLAHGDQVFAGCRNPDKASDLQSLLSGFRSQLTVVPLDVADEKSIESSQKIVSQSVDAIDLLINNAARQKESESIANITAELMMESFKVNAMAPILVVKHYLTLLKAGDAPTVVNISSEAGSTQELKEYRESYSYGASKAALNMFTRTSAYELTDEKIRVIAIHPGFVHTKPSNTAAKMEPPQSVSGILKVINNLKDGETDKFYTFEGAENPW